MTKQLTNILAFTVVIVSLTSCGGVARYVYSPPPATITYFKEKGDNQLSASISSGPNDQYRVGNFKYNSGYDIQAGYAFTNHWYVAGSYFNRKEGESANDYGNIFDTSTIKYKRNIVEFGSGYILPLNAARSSTFNLYGALGFGNFEFNEYGLLNGFAYARQHQINITKYSIQGGFNLMPYDFLHLSFTGRFSFVHYGKSNNNYTNNELSYFYLNEIENRTIRFFEPTINVQLGLPDYKWVKLNMSLTFCGADDYISRRKNNVSMGLTFSLPKKSKKR